MTFIQILYLSAVAVSLGAGLPQMLRLMQTKDSSGLSLTTWRTWVFTQLVSLLYSLSIGDKLLVMVNILWVSFYLTMAAMIIKYRVPVERMAEDRVESH